MRAAEPEGAESLRKAGASLWSGVASLFGEEFALHLTFRFDGQDYVAKVGLAAPPHGRRSSPRAGSRSCTSSPTRAGRSWR